MGEQKPWLQLQLQSLWTPTLVSFQVTLMVLLLTLHRTLRELGRRLRIQRNSWTLIARILVADAPTQAFPA